MSDLPHRFLIAPDKFKGTMNAPGAARAMAAGARDFSRARGLPAPQCRLRPLADGGEGSHDVLKEIPGLAEERMELTGADGRPVAVPYLVQSGDDERHFYLETALVIGLQNPAHRAVDIMDRTTAGVGEWIESLTRAHLRKPDTAGPASLYFHLFLGGSSTSDGGFGLARALGFSFYDDDDAEIRELRGLDRLKTVLAPGPTIFDPRIVVRVYTDVQNPLLGDAGAARLFGPQKGANPAQVTALEERIRRLESGLIGGTGLVDHEQPGLGAAGGLALPLVYWSRGLCEFLSGIDFFLEATGIPRELRDDPPDLILTGEGAADRGTLAGKVPAGLARLGRQARIPVALFAGVVKPGDRPALEAAGDFAAIFDTSEFCETLEGLPDEATALDRLRRTVAAGLERMYGSGETLPS